MVYSAQEAIHSPSSEDLQDFYPPSALDQGKGASTRVHCRVTVKGLTADCAVTSEDPPGLGFDKAALKAARLYRFKPQSTNGQAAEGSVTIPIRWTAK